MVFGTRLYKGTNPPQSEVLFVFIFGLFPEKKNSFKFSKSSSWAVGCGKKCFGISLLHCKLQSNHSIQQDFISTAPIRRDWIWNNALLWLSQYCCLVAAAIVKLTTYGWGRCFAHNEWQYEGCHRHRLFAQCDASKAIHNSTEHYTEHFLLEQLALLTT